MTPQPTTPLNAPHEHDAPAAFDAGQRAELSAAFRSGLPLLCPACDSPLDERAIPTRADVPYVRDRLWIVCPRCRKGAVLDRREPV